MIVLTNQHLYRLDLPCVQLFKQICDPNQISKEGLF